MILDISEATLSKVQNPVLKKYAGQYVDIYLDFLEQVARTGIEIEDTDYTEQAKQKIEALERRGVILSNDRKSLRIGNISPACVACQTGMGSATFFISLRCDRNCFYCFNPNQENYGYYRKNKRDVIEELKQIRENKLQLSHLALTGGEPLLHKEDTIDFFEFVKNEFPEVYSRLYTSGDRIDAEVLKSLNAAGLQEIRISIRMHDLPGGHEGVFKRISLAREYIPYVMVEMPVLPGTQEEMQDILVELDRIGLFSINLLEFCYPFTNPQAYQKRGYKIKKPPFRMLYDYWYAGGLPVSGSELDCLDLLAFVLDSNLSLGLHYCSLENKQTGQLYQQNSSACIPSTAYFSQRDYLLKTAKVFGTDVLPVRSLFDRDGFKNYRIDPGNDALEFHVTQMDRLKELEIEVGIASGVIENRKDGYVFRELKVDVARPEAFNLSMDV